MRNPLRSLGLFFALMPFGSSFAQNQHHETTLDKIVETTFVVKDFDVWRPQFLKDSLMRKQYGIDTFITTSKIGEPQYIMNVATVDDVANAKKAMDNHATHSMEAMREMSGVKNVYYQVVRFVPSPNGTKWMIMNHRVKDFDTWFAGFQKGKSIRDAAGLVDVLVARNIDDPNMVQVVNDITDMKKAKEFPHSKILKKRMKMAGVIGTPEVAYYETR